MSPFVNDPDFVLHVGDALDVLGTLPDESVHCVVTSPPYWGLRDYGTGSWDGGDDGCDHDVVNAERTPWANSVPGPAGATAKNAKARNETKETGGECGKCGARRVDHQLGLEPTPDEYVTSMVNVFREVRRVLRRDGTCWLNIGDSYAGSWGNQGRKEERGTQRPINGEMLTPVLDGRYPDKGSNTGAVPPGLKPKDLVGIPWRLAFALQADGWYLRSDIIWAKPNPMPESVTDRPTKAHEYLFLLTKSARYFYDADAIREPAEWARWGDQTNGKHEGSGSAAGWIGAKSKAELTSRKSDAVGVNGRNVQETNAESERRDEVGGSFNNNPRLRSNVGRNKRSVWEIATEPYPDAHFATFPQALVEPCVLAGTSERGCCPVCGAPWERDVLREVANRVGGGRGLNGDRADGGKACNADRSFQTIGWHPTCECRSLGVPAGDLDAEMSRSAPPVPCTVLDPFMGSGTVAVVARRLGRRAVGIELNPEYALLASKRLAQLSLLAA